MDVDCARIVDGVKVAFAAEHRAHLFGRPTFDFTTKLANKAGKVGKLVAVVGLGDVEPAILRFDPGQVILADGVADIVQPALRQRPQILGSLKANPANDAIGRCGKTRQYKAGVAARSTGGDATGLDEHHGPTAAGDLARGRQARKPTADHANFDVEIDR